MKRIAIIGGGISGLTCAQLLKERYDVTIFEKAEKVGGLIRCERVNGSLFHLCGGHVFNTKNQQVYDWFWSKFDKERDFVKADRRSAVCLEDGRFVDYPIENHVYQLDDKIQQNFISDLKELIRSPACEAKNFREFLLQRFGKTLYDLYFKPYNDKVWRRDLSEIPLSWLAGKLPMPTVDEMLLANMNHSEEKQFVHSTFYYERQGGSQFIADTLSKQIPISVNTPVTSMIRNEKGWMIEGLIFDKVVFCGNLKDLPHIAHNLVRDGYANEIERLESHGTTSVFCETDSIPYSWFYQPTPRHRSHRFICTGNFSPTNNAPGKMTCTVEFTDEMGVDDIKQQLRIMPFHPKYVTHHYSASSYPIQHQHTREMVRGLKGLLSSKDFYLCGRFAEWEYYNMDAAMASAFSLTEQIA